MSVLEALTSFLAQLPNFLQVFSNESKTLLTALPSLGDKNAPFFSTETSGSAPVDNLDKLKEDIGKRIWPFRAAYAIRIPLLPFKGSSAQCSCLQVCI